MGALVDRIINALPSTVVLLSTLIPNTNYNTEANIDIINAALPSIVQTRAANGASIYLADMHTNYITTADLNQVDGIHPNDGKYPNTPVLIV